MQQKLKFSFKILVLTSNSKRSSFFLKIFNLLFFGIYLHGDCAVLTRDAVQNILAFENVQLFIGYFTNCATGKITRQSLSNS